MKVKNHPKTIREGGKIIKEPIEDHDIQFRLQEKKVDNPEVVTIKGIEDDVSAVNDPQVQDHKRECYENLVIVCIILCIIIILSSPLNPALSLSCEL